MPYGIEWARGKSERGDEKEEEPNEELLEKKKNELCVLCTLIIHHIV